MWRGELPRENYPACELIMYNLSDKLVVSCEVTLLLQGKDGEELERLIYRAHALEGHPRSVFSMVVPVDESLRPTGLEVIIEKVWYDDNDVWRRGKGSLCEYTSNALPNGRNLELLRFVAGSNAVGYPENQDGVWVCVCGRPNPPYLHSCVRCQRSREQVFARYNKEAIEKIAAQRDQQLALKAKAAREDASRLQLEREQAYDQKKKKQRRTVKIAVLAAAGVAVVYGVVFHGLPYLRYRGAVSAFESGDYAQAQSVFAAMEGYADADAYVLRCRYETALELLDAQDQESLTQAGETFRELADYENSAAYAQEADYRLGKLLLSQGKAEEASALFTALGDYADCAEQIKACDYLLAKGLLDQGSYLEAQVAFEALGDYSDAPALAQEAIYQSGKAALERTDWDNAILYLSQTAGYQDTDTLLPQAHYGKALELQAAGDYTQAGEHFLAAGDYQDAQEQAIACIYAPAKEAMDSGDYATAAELFGKIPDYEDSSELYIACTYEVARTAMKDLEYNRALGLLNTIPETYEDVFDLKMDCLYLPGEAALEKGEYDTAVQYLSQVSTYQDAAKLLEEARFGQAVALTDAGDYDAAIASLTDLGDYKGAEKELQRAKYLKAGKLLENKDWAAAAALYAELEDYSDSEIRWQAAVYGQADAAYAGGDAATAMTLFASLENYSDAAERAKQCGYDQARALADQGQGLEAADLFASLGEYSDAPAQAQQLYYLLATEAANSNQVLSAARLYAKAGAYQDAATQSRAYYDAYYQTASVEASDAMSNGEYALVVTLLGHMDLTELPEFYEGLDDMYQEANYLQGNLLYNEGKPYEALPYYRAIPEYKDVASRLERNCYAILGTWRNDNGVTFVFQEDGTCDLNGEKLYFLVDNYTMETGLSADALSNTHKVSSLSEDSLTLRDLRGSTIVTYKMTRVTEESAPEAEETAAPAESYAVTDD